MSRVRTPQLWELLSTGVTHYAMAQQKISEFLSPPPPARNQSQTTPPPGQSSPKTGSVVHDPPSRVNKKSKKAQKQQRKRDRKRAKLHRACKKGSQYADPSSPHPISVTPMPSPGSPTWGAEVVHNMGDSMLLCDTSLTDMLASDNVPKSTSDDACSLVNESPDDAILRHEARVLAGDIELQGVCDERAALQHQVDLLMSEIDSFNKKDKAQKIEIKRLTRDNDKLRKDISKFNGMRKYMGADEQNSTVSNIVNDTERCNSHKCKLLRSKLIGVTDSLLTALDDDNDNDVAVVNGAKRNQPAPGPRQAHPPVSTTSNGPVSFATVAATRTSRTRFGGTSPCATNAIRVIVATAYPSGWDRSCCSPCCSSV